MNKVFVLGSFVVDLMCRTPHLPARGETVFGGPFKLGPGGKGSNQAVAAKRAGADVTFMTKLGQDEFGALAQKTFAAEGLPSKYIYTTPDAETGAALIMVEDGSAENMITVSVGACHHVSDAEVLAAEKDIAASKVFLTQFETNLSATFLGLSLAQKHSVTTILNPAPVQKVSREKLKGLDYITPNETEATHLSGIPVTDMESAAKAAQWFLDSGVGTVLLTMGEKGVLVMNRDMSTFVPAYDIGQPADTTGAGDAFNGGFACALAEGKELTEAVRFGCAVAAICVTRVGTAPAMPKRQEVEALMAQGRVRKVA
ncbi:MAG: ribokinase [Proteobacteria bacterium]|nr:ribokinase [Pseudomonadota bacterium]